MNTNKGNSNVTTYNASTVWAAAAKATDINKGEYLKEPKIRHFKDDRPPIVTNLQNKVIVQDILAGKYLQDEKTYPNLETYYGLELSNEHYERGEAARNYWRMSILVKILDETATDFERDASKVAELEEIDSRRQASLISCLIKLADDAMARDKVNDEKAALGSEHIGIPGTQEEVTFEVLECRFIKGEIYRYAVDGVVNGKDLVFFWYSSELPKGAKFKTRARVKAHGEDKFTGAAVTRLHYIRKLEDVS